MCGMFGGSVGEGRRVMLAQENNQKLEPFTRIWVPAAPSLSSSILRLLVSALVRRSEDRNERLFLMS